MERMLCAQCEAVTYSAAARRLVERGERCTRCGGELLLATRAGEPVRVGPRGGEPHRKAG